jgi:hypothetical protein
LVRFLRSHKHATLPVRRCGGKSVPSLRLATPTLGGELSAAWTFAGGRPKQFEIAFAFGAAEVRDDLGRYMVERGIAHKRRMLRKVRQLFDRLGKPLEEVLDERDMDLFVDSFFDTAGRPRKAAAQWLSDVMNRIALARRKDLHLNPAVRSGVPSTTTNLARYRANRYALRCKPTGGPSNDH